MLPGRATLCRRAARLTMSPTTTKSCPGRSPNVLTTTSPVSMPTRISQRDVVVRGDLGVELVERVAHAQGGADRPMGILLLGCAHAEHGHHGVADELLDDAAVGLDVLVPAQEVGVDDRADVLGVELLRQHGEVDEVGEQDGDELALLGDGAADELGALGEQRPEGRVDDGVAEQAALRFERGDSVVDRRQVRHHHAG